MSDPHVSPKGETPMQRRERLMNLTNPDWSPPPTEEPTPEEPETPEPVLEEPTSTPKPPTKE